MENPGVSNVMNLFASLIFDKNENSLVTVSPFSSSILKLNSENFLVWKSQILPILRGHKLDKFVLTDEPEFMQVFVFSDAKVNDHSLSRFSVEQQVWILQDQLLLGWLTAAIKVEELANLTTKKGSMKILDYCKKMKKIADKMCSGGFLVSEKELVMCILNGLGPKFETVRVNYTSRPPLPSLQELTLGSSNTLPSSSTTLNTSNHANSSIHKDYSTGKSGLYERRSFEDFRGRGYYGRGRDVKFIGSGYSGQASANVVTTPVLVGDPNWYLDSGATNHVVADGGNLMHQFDYSGNNKLLVGNSQSH
ncbi:uncharacterized protein LOC132803649 [Ziziphus jujuba]|uniref:Uncharacterized protein LOC132803649 n=1 Tax=Ziziphus jujuba TaxID=326968 RepID=A0ABM4A894_ZIZJJ|nr:uncharacterized protein LOC132803649 [Ziziphus jujuba]